MSTGSVRETTGDGSRQTGRGRQYRNEVWDCWTFDICAGFNRWMCPADSGNKFVRLTFGRPQGVSFSTAFSQAEHPLCPRQRVSDPSNWQDAYGIQSPVHSYGRPALKDAATAEPLALELVCLKRPKGVELVVTVPTPVDSGRSDCDPRGRYGPRSLAVYDDSGVPLR